jgi:subtilisin family serine protease
MRFIRAWPRFAAPLLLIIAATAPSAPASNRSWLAQLGADRWHAEGYRGQGVKVVVLDSGFRGWRSWLGTALPSRIEARSFRLDRQLEARDSSHGVMCGEVIHSLAPDAEILFANWESDRPDTFVQAVVWARQQGARVLTCSVIMPSWSDGEGGGPVHAGLADVIGRGSQSGDMICCACAGNTAQRHWSGQCHSNSDGWHEWRPGQTDNGITPWSTDERVSVEMCWSADTNYRIVVVEAASGVEIGRAQGIPDGAAQCAVVRFAPRSSVKYSVRVQPLGSSRGAFHLAVLGGWLETYIERGSICFPADGAEFLAVGAWDEAGRRAAYSSCGPNSPTLKPDFVGMVPVQTRVRSRPFSGTSAAAPQAAGIAALICSRRPEWTANQVKGLMRSAAIDVAAPGVDAETGYGLLRLPPP